MNTFSTSQDQIFTVNYAYSKHNGSGNKKILVEIASDSGDLKIFSSFTNDMPAYDSANDLEGQEKWEALYVIISDNIDDEVSDWLYELDEENN